MSNPTPFTHYFRRIGSNAPAATPRPAPPANPPTPSDVVAFLTRGINSAATEHVLIAAEQLRELCALASIAATDIEILLDYEGQMSNPQVLRGDARAVVDAVRKARELLP